MSASRQAVEEVIERTLPAPRPPQPAAEPAEVPEPPVYAFWWLHDARWYQEVSKRFGQAAANELNAEALRFVARRVAQWYTKTHRLDFNDLPIDGVIDHFAGIFRAMSSDGMFEYELNGLGGDEWETVITKSYSLRMLRAARSLEGYECPCLEMRAGWFDGMGVSVRDSCVECQRTGGSACRFRAVLQRPLPADRPAED
jgi:hypothetical protein